MSLEAETTRQIRWSWNGFEWNSLPPQLAWLASNLTKCPKWKHVFMHQSAVVCLPECALISQAISRDLLPQMIHIRVNKFQPFPQYVAQRQAPNTCIQKSDIVWSTTNQKRPQNFVGFFPSCVPMSLSDVVSKIEETYALPEKLTAHAPEEWMFWRWTGILKIMPFEF